MRLEEGQYARVVRLVESVLVPQCAKNAAASFCGSWMEGAVSTLNLASGGGVEATGGLTCFKGFVFPLSTFEVAGRSVSLGGVRLGHCNYQCEESLRQCPIQ